MLWNYWKMGGKHNGLGRCTKGIDLFSFKPERGYFGDLSCIEGRY
jgi:hypothetical protein